MYEKSESLRSSDSSSSTVDLIGKYPRKYWSIKKCSITVRCRSTVAKAVDHKNFRNEFRYFLYCRDPKLDEIIEMMEWQDQAYLLKYEQEYNTVVHPDKNFEGYLEGLGIDDRISIQIREYEKEFFYLKILPKEKPQIVLRGLLRLAQEKKRDEVFTAPEILFSMIKILPGKPIYRKDVKFVTF